MSLGRILVVEDDQQIADVVEHLLKSNDYEVRTAADGQAALRQFKSYRPDLVFLDLNLPRLSGWEVLRQIRQERSDIPVIMLTSQTEEADRVLGLERG
ncbi:MAG TPA: response regulator, partial [Kiritimatiellia bacterium]|nr:response regulator [Kiritimatiellia bacterium]